MKETNPGRELTKAAKIAAATLFVTLVILLPTAWGITRGYLPIGSDKLAVGAALMIGAYTAQIASKTKKGGGEGLRIVPQGLLLAMYMLVLGAAITKGRLSPVRILPFIGIAAAGYVAAVLTKVNKKYTMKKKRRKRYYK